MVGGAVPGSTEDGTIRCSVPEAARLLGISERAVRKRLTSGTLAGVQEGVHGPWTVHLPFDLAAGAADAARGGGTGTAPGAVGGAVPGAVPAEPPAEPGAAPIEAAYRVTPAEIERAVERTGARYLADMETILARVGRVYEGQLAAKDETIAELRRRAEAAEAERDELRARPAAATPSRIAPMGGPGATAAPRATDITPEAHRPLQGLWRRLRRLRRG